MTKYFVDMEAPENHDLAQALRERFEKGLVKFSLPGRISTQNLTLEYDPEYRLWGIETVSFDLDGPYWQLDLDKGDEAGRPIATGLIVHTFEDLPYDPAGCSPYLGKYIDPVTGYCTAEVKPAVTPLGDVIRVTIAASPATLEQYYSDVLSRSVEPTLWWQPRPSPCKDPSDWV